MLNDWEKASYDISNFKKYCELKGYKFIGENVPRKDVISVKKVSLIIAFITVIFIIPILLILLLWPKKKK